MVGIETDRAGYPMEMFRSVQNARARKHGYKVREIRRKSNEVIVSIKNGAVIDVEAPPNVDVFIRDYDVDGIDIKRLQLDEDGNAF